MKFTNHHITQDHSPPIVSLLLSQTLKIINMKQLLLFFTAVFFLSFFSFAQLDKKNWLVGGSGNFSSSKTTTSVAPSYYSQSNEINVQVSPNIGYFFVDKFLIGIRPSFSWFKAENTTPVIGGATSNVKRFYIGPFVRYYFLEKEKQANVFAETSYQFGFFSFKPAKASISSFSINAGTVIYFNSSVGLEFMAGYSSWKEEKKEVTKDTRKSFVIGLGFQFYLEKL